MSQNKSPINSISLKTRAGDIVTKNHRSYLKVDQLWFFCVDIFEILDLLISGLVFSAHVDPNASVGEEIHSKNVDVVLFYVQTYEKGNDFVPLAVLKS